MPVEDQLTTEPSGDRLAVLEFVRSPFTIRRNAVAVWRRPPRGLWTELNQPQDNEPARRTQRRAVAGVMVISVLLILGFSGLGIRSNASGGEAALSPMHGRRSRLKPAARVMIYHPLFEKSFVVEQGHSNELGQLGQLDWYYAWGQSWIQMLCGVVAPLGGWIIVRAVWLPVLSRSKPSRQATLSLARHLGSVYYFVFLVLLVGAAIMLLLLLISPAGTTLIRFFLGLLLFGESFFVPAVMWSRLILSDTEGRIFGRRRLIGLTAYLMVFVALPIAGMIVAFL